MLNLTHALPVGTIVVYFNLWTSFEHPEIRKSFSRMKADDVAKLKVGDTVWLDQDPIHPQGKVYGYHKVKISMIVPTERGWTVNFASSSLGGARMLDRGQGSGFARVEDEIALAELVSRNPLALKIGL